MILKFKKQSGFIRIYSNRLFKTFFVEEHPDTASKIIQEVKGLKINNIYGSKSGISYSLTK